MKLNDLSKKAWVKLSKTFWSTQNAIKHLEAMPLSIDSFYLGKIKQSTLPNIDDARVKLIELLTCEQQVVMGDEITKKAAVSVNRQFMLLGEKSKNLDLIIEEISHQDNAHQEERLKNYWNSLDNRAYLALIVSDYRNKEGYHLFHADVAKDLQRIGFNIRSLMILVKEQQLLRPYGYPKTFVSNITNKFVILAQK